ncbi:pantoate--beta-alanine ligase [Rhodobacteraceae bacterium MCCB 386]|nr:pantoate--beta-alanine ligase [Roseitranquillus sediminis]
MIVCPSKGDIRTAVNHLRGRGRTIGLVPTMGALHEGHMALVARAAELADRVVATIFVNPTQFGPNEDLSTYPRTLERDLQMLREAGVAAVFAPEPGEMYHTEAQTVVETTGLSRVLMGRLRPGHFRGVATVVTKLFNIVQPDIAVFGEKDYQQLAVIRTMVRDLDIPVRIEGVPTQRAPDGLALSSRNARLTEAQRAAAPVLSQAMAEAAELLAEGETAEIARARIARLIAAEPLAQLRSADIRDAASLAPVRGRPARPVVILLAVRFGDVTLIDQRVVQTRGEPT